MVSGSKYTESRRTLRHENLGGVMFTNILDTALVFHDLADS
jgi:hypothetical protein